MQKKLTQVEIDPTRPLLLLKVADVAEMTQISISQVYSLVKEGQLPAVRFGTAIRILPEDLQEFIELNRTETE